MRDDEPGPARTVSGRTQAERRAETERRVLDAAVQLIAASGSRSVSLAQVGLAAGYSRGIVTHQFGTKEELLSRVAYYAQSAFTPPETTEQGLERLLLTVDAYLADLMKLAPTTRAFLQMWAEAVALEPVLRRIFVERDAGFRGLFAALVAEGIAEGSIDPQTDAAAISVALVGQLRGIGLQLMLAPDAAAHDTIRRETVAMIRRGLQRGPEQPTRASSASSRRKKQQA